MPGDRADLPRARLLRLDPIQGVGHVQLDDLGPLDRAVRPAPRHLLPATDRPVANPAERQAPEVGGGVQVGHQRLERRILLVRRRGHVREQGVEQGSERVLQRVGRPPAVTVPGVRVQDREIDLVLVGIEVQEQLFDLVDDLLHPGVGTVNLVDHQDDGQPRFERLPQHEPRLRQGTLGRVDQQQDAVDHRERPLHLSPEIGVPGGIHDVDLDVAESHRRVLGQDRDALLPLEIHGVHHPLGHVLVRPERAGLPQHGVHQGGLAVIDVGHDGHVADVVSAGHASSVEMTRNPSRSLRLAPYSGVRSAPTHPRTPEEEPTMVRPLHPKERQLYSRRAFLQRAALAGIAVPSLSAILAACGSGAQSSVATSAASGGTWQPVRHRRHRGRGLSAGTHRRASDVERR